MIICFKNRNPKLCVNFSKRAQTACYAMEKIKKKNKKMN